jgi:polyisoprenoid-binding protein YceI
MKLIIRTLAVGFALLLPQMASASTWLIDPDHSNIGFSVKHLMISNVKGNFIKFDGTVDLNDRDITKSTVAVNIDPSSINTNIQKRDDHLRSADFFDVAKYPEMKFSSRRWVHGARGGLKVTGDLTIHGVTREVVLDVKPFSKESKDPWGNIRRSTSATAKINRKDFGLVWNKSLETGGVLVGDQVDISLEVEMIKSASR